MTAFRRVSSLLLIALLTAGVLAACSSSGSTRSSGVQGNRIILDSLSFDPSGASAYQLIQDVRPQWLRPRGPTSINASSGVSVYVSTTSSRYGGVGALRTIQTANVEYIEFLTGSEAQFRFGLDNSDGAIFVQFEEARKPKTSGRD